MVFTLNWRIDGRSQTQIEALNNMVSLLEIQLQTSQPSIPILPIDSPAIQSPEDLRILLKRRNVLALLRIVLPNFLKRMYPTIRNVLPNLSNYRNSLFLILIYLFESFFVLLGSWCLRLLKSEDVYVLCIVLFVFFLSIVFCNIVLV